MTAEQSGSPEETWERVVGSPPPELTSASRRITAGLMHEIWPRPNLSMRERRLVTITAILMSVGGTPLRTHLKAALDAGDLTAEDLEELGLHLSMYGGWPRGNVLREALTSVQASGNV
jgi:4-carboxymuconolactone decarboxylase